MFETQLKVQKTLSGTKPSSGAHFIQTLILTLKSRVWPLETLQQCAVSAGDYVVMKVLWELSATLLQPPWVLKLVDSKWIFLKCIFPCALNALDSHSL